MSIYPLVGRACGQVSLFLGTITFLSCPHAWKFCQKIAVPVLLKSCGLFAVLGQGHAQ